MDEEESTNPRRRKFLLASLPVATFGLGYWVAPKEELAHEVQEGGFFAARETEVLSATVESLRAESELVVWSYQGTVKVRATDTDWLVFESEQHLIVPASVDYRLNLQEFSLADVRFDEKAALVRVTLPKLKLSDVAFYPEQATAINGGLLTFSDEKVQALNKRAYRSASGWTRSSSRMLQSGWLNFVKNTHRPRSRSYG